MSAWSNIQSEVARLDHSVKRGRANEAVVKAVNALAEEHADFGTRMAALHDLNEMLGFLNSRASALTRMVGRPGEDPSA